MLQDPQEHGRPRLLRGLEGCDVRALRHVCAIREAGGPEQPRGVLEDLPGRVLEQDRREGRVDEHDARRAVHHGAVAPHGDARALPVDQCPGLLELGVAGDGAPVHALDVASAVRRTDEEPVLLHARESGPGPECALEEEFDHVAAVVDELAHGPLIDLRVGELREPRSEPLLRALVELDDVTLAVASGHGDGLVGDDLGQDVAELAGGDELVELGVRDAVLAHHRETDERGGRRHGPIVGEVERGGLPVGVVPVAVVQGDLAGEPALDVALVEPRRVAREDDAAAAVGGDVRDEAGREGHALVGLVRDAGASALAGAVALAALVAVRGLVGAGGGRGGLGLLGGGHDGLLFSHGGETWGV